MDTKNEALISAFCGREESLYLNTVSFDLSFCSSPAELRANSLILFHLNFCDLGELLDI